MATTGDAEARVPSVNFDGAGVWVSVGTGEPFVRSLGGGTIGGRIEGAGVYVCVGLADAMNTPERTVGGGVCVLVGMAAVGSGDLLISTGSTVGFGVCVSVGPRLGL